MRYRIESDMAITSVRLLIWNLAILFGALLFSDIEDLALWNHGLLFWTILVTGCLTGSLTIIIRGRSER